MSEITKEEISALTDSNIKLALALERMVTILSGLSESNKDIAEKLSNGLCTITRETLTSSKANADKLKDIYDNVFWLKVIMGSTAFIAFGLLVTDVIKKIFK